MRISRWTVPGFVAVAVLSLAAVASAGVTTVKSPNRTLDPFSRATVSCPNGSHVLGGGFRTDPGALIQINRPKGGRLWQAEGLLDPAVQFHLRVLARCEPNSAGGVKVVKASKAVPKDTRSVVDVTCPRGRQALAGGYAVSPPFTGGPGDAGEIAPDTSRRVGPDTWRVAGVNEGDGSTRLVSYAICGRIGARGKIKTASASAALHPGHTSATAKCSRGWHTLGGGFSTPGELKLVFPNISVAAPSGSRGWKVTLDIPVSGPMRSSERRAPGGNIHSYAYCAKNGS